MDKNQEREFIIKPDFANGLEFKKCEDVFKRFKPYFTNHFVSKHDMDAESFRIQSCITFCKKYSIEHEVSYKQPTVGCKEVIQYRYNPQKKDFGIDLQDEQKSIIFKKNKDIFCYITPANCDAVCPKKSSKLDITKYGLIPYTVNPATILGILHNEAKKDDLTLHLVVNPLIAKDGLVFNNYGSRILSVCYNGKQVFDAIIKEASDLGIDVEISSDKFIKADNIDLSGFNESIIFDSSSDGTSYSNMLSLSSFENSTKSLNSSSRILSDNQQETKQKHWSSCSQLLAGDHDRLYR